MAKPCQLFDRRRAARVRTHAEGTRRRASASFGPPFGRHIYAQIIDDAQGRDDRCGFDAGQGRKGLKTGATLELRPRRSAS